MPTAARRLARPLRRVAPAVAALGLIASLAGCAQSRQTTGRQIPDAKVARIVKGQTTLEEVITTFGKPDFQQAMGDRMLYTYKYCENTGSGLGLPGFSQQKMKENCDELTITFDENDRVSAYNLYRGVVDPSNVMGS